MTHIIRAATTSDLDALYDLSKITGGGFTNLPPDRGTLAEKLERTAASFAREGETQEDDLYVFMLEDLETGRIRGTCQVFGKVGVTQPFYSYRISTQTQQSKELDRIFRNQLLTPCNDLEGSSEVGGLFLHPAERAGGLGLLLARSRYLFIKQNRPRFGARILAELRGVIDPGGHSPFWDAIGGKFFGMTFPEADEFNATNGTQFIADLFPQSPIYVSMLPESAQAVIGQPHPTGRAALKMLQKEGFVWDNYVDIFDGGPTVVAATDNVQSIKRADWYILDGDCDGEECERTLAATGRLADFKCASGRGKIEKGHIRLDSATIAALELEPGDTVLAVGR
ncbi:arginine N-succinyltransferase [Sphingomicrobium clamense]|uniref:Arginine N-succinyltransferase n=1 Tax=Sphingomicrobium clamense TaxID=2851013 RepID=A0ABS6V7H5_9SPHN|nr:arginine N-succinyltransferase [Sphingomicrobium sp. B8]MBW0145529.1 arginine N-succinyltransferase [Sphingomicrobium sp. B8]